MSADEQINRKNYVGQFKKISSDKKNCVEKTVYTESKCKMVKKNWEDQLP